jgi:hypothetical protein
MDFLKMGAGFAASRLKEPSTYAGLTGVLVAWHIPGAPLWAQVLIAAASTAAAVIGEKGAAALKE